MTLASPDSDDSIAGAKRRDKICDEFEKAWLSGSRPRLEDALTLVADAERATLFHELLRVELHYLRKRGENPSPDEYARRFPAFESAVDAAFELTTPVGPPKPTSRPTPGRFAAGDILAGRYRIVAQVGVGGMGEVFRADDLDLGEQVALKFLPSARAMDPAWVSKLKQEVALARRVTHVNVCRVHDLGEADGQTFLVMEFVDGKSLDSIRRMLRRIDPEQVINYARQLCDGLQAVHNKQLLHRDLKPGNVLLDGDGRILLADFGLAAIAADMGSEDAGAGTVLYMAPEQLLAENVTVQSDLFALGLILYELVTGERPFPAGSREELRRQHAELTPVTPSKLASGIDPALDQVTLRCLARDPRQRPASAQEVKDALPPLSPKMTRQEGGTGTLRPQVAVAVLAAALLGLFLNARLAESTMAFHQVGTIKAPNYLRERAVELARDFGYLDPVTMEASALEWDTDLVRHATLEQSSVWNGQGDRAPPLMYFWYRASPRMLVSTSRITPVDPPMTEPGMYCVLLDPQGKLIEFHAVPARTASPRPGTAEEIGDKLLAAAGLDKREFRKAPPARRPTAFAEAAWSYERIDGGTQRVDVAVCDGKPVYFRVGEPFGREERPDRTEAASVASMHVSQRRFGMYGLGIMVTALALTLPVVVRNLRLGRCDVQAAFRLGGIYLALVLGWWLLTARHCPTLEAERALITNVLGFTAFWGTLLVVMYLALEPYMRRRWPERLSSWNRLLSGRVTDPLVGRDLLFGVGIGTVLALILKGAALGGGTFAAYVPIAEILCPDVPLGAILALLSLALVRMVVGFGYLIIFGLVLRREWLALLFLAAIVAGNTEVASPTLDLSRWTTWAGCFAIGGLVVLTIARFGLITTLAAHFTAAVINVMPITTNPQSWYAGTTATSAALLVALAVYGFFVSLGGQKLIPDEL